MCLERYGPVAGHLSGRTGHANLVAFNLTTHHPRKGPFLLLGRRAEMLSISCGALDVYPASKLTDQSSRGIRGTVEILSYIPVSLAPPSEIQHWQLAHLLNHTGT